MEFQKGTIVSMQRRGNPVLRGLFWNPERFAKNPAHEGVMDVLLEVMQVVKLRRGMFYHGEFPSPSEFQRRRSLTISKVSRTTSYATLFIYSRVECAALTRDQTAQGVAVSATRESYVLARTQRTR